MEDDQHGSSPASRGGAGTYIEGELGAFYLLAMLAGIPAHGMPGARIVRVRFQGTDLGYSLDDLILHGASPSGDALLEIQSKRDITFAPKDTVYREVAGQIARSKSDKVAEERHFLGIATQRTSRKISGAYQDVLKWAAAAETSDQFYERLDAKGVANDDSASSCRRRAKISLPAESPMWTRRSGGSAAAVDPRIRLRVECAAGPDTCPDAGAPGPC